MDHTAEDHIPSFSPFDPAFAKGFCRVDCLFKKCCKKYKKGKRCKDCPGRKKK